MRIKSAVLIAILCSTTNSVSQSPETPKPLLPQAGIWKMRYDGKVDGELSGKVSDDVQWKFAMRNNHVTGSLVGLKEGDASDHKIAGEVVEGKPAILFLRQDGPKGLVCFYSGKRLDDGRFTGTWFDNRGNSGDFELIEQK